MEKTFLETAIFKQPIKIYACETNLQRAKILLVQSKDDYECAKNRILLEVDADGNQVINGKNAEIREAQINKHLEAFHSMIREGEERVMKAESELNFELNTFRALRSVAAIVGGKE